jgi:hypothetical protein
MLLAATPPNRIADVRAVFRPAFTSVGVCVQDNPPFNVTMLFKGPAGRLAAANRFAFHD